MGVGTGVGVGEGVAVGRNGTRVGTGVGVGATGVGVGDGVAMSTVGGAIRSPGMAAGVGSSPPHAAKKTAIVPTAKIGIRRNKPILGAVECPSPT